MQGKLVPQDPTDKPAFILLEKIKVEKDRLIKEKRIRKDELLPLIKANEEPFSLPNMWGWAYLGQISIMVHYGYTASANHAVKEIRLLRITDIQNSRVIGKMFQDVKLM